MITEQRREYYRLYRLKNLERLRQYDKERNVTTRAKRNRAYHKVYYQKNKERIRLRVDRWRQKNRDKRSAYIQSWRDELFEIWGNSHSNCKAVQERAHLAERLMEKVFLGLGFSVLYIAGFAKNFPVDLIIKKNGVIYGVLVSTYPRVKVKSHVLRLAKFLAWEILCAFVRPTFSDYHLVYLDASRKTASVPKRVVVGGGMEISHELRASIQ